MEAGKRYLIRKIEAGSKGDLLEISCLEASKEAYKILFNTRARINYPFLSDGKEPFWILKSDIDTKGDAKFQLIEELATT